MFFSSTACSEQKPKEDVVWRSVLSSTMIFIRLKIQKWGFLNAGACINNR